MLRAHVSLVSRGTNYRCPCRISAAIAPDIIRLRANRDAQCVRIIAEPQCDEWNSNSINAIQIMQRAFSNIRYLPYSLAPNGLDAASSIQILAYHQNEQMFTNYIHFRLLQNAKDKMKLFLKRDK